MLKRDVLSAVCGRDVIIYPDRDAIDEWKNIIKGLSDIANFIVSDFCERTAPPEATKYDIADYIISNRYQEYPF